MNNLQIFKNNEFGEIRGKEIDDKIWFAGVDLTTKLEYQNGSRDIKRHVDEEDKLIRQITVSGQGRNMNLINESGLYSLILLSKLPTAKKFKRWVASDILPNIRKHGMYATDELVDNPDLLIEVATKLKEERQARIKAEEKVIVQKNL